MRSAIYYLRVSTDTQREGILAQLETVKHIAAQHELPFSDKAESIHTAIQSGGMSAGDIYFDVGISGYSNERPGLHAFLSRAQSDSSVTHLVLPDRSRLARPEDESEFMGLENRLRLNGKTLIIGNEVLPPLARGDNDIANKIKALVDYSQGRTFLTHLGRKMVTVKANCVRAGHWPGGRPPYGFIRVLATADGAIVRALNDGESVRQHGMHSTIRVADVEKVRNWYYILNLFDPLGDDLGGKSIARALNAHLIPSPDAGRRRRGKYDSQARLVPGIWVPSEVFARIDDPTLFGVLRYGKRSLGDHVRLGAGGVPRQLKSGELKSGTHKTKAVKNPTDVVIERAGDWITDEGWLLDVQGQKCFKVDRTLFERCRAKRQINGRSQKGIARCRDASRYPLAGRVRCAHCREVMHGMPYPSGSLCYKCGRYTNSCGAQCGHYWVAQDELLEGVLLTLSTSVIPQEDQLRAAIEQIVRERGDNRAQSLNNKRHLAVLKQAEDRALSAVAAAKDDIERDALRKIYLDERDKRMEIERRVVANEVPLLPTENLVEKAMAELNLLTERLNAPEDRAGLKEMFAAMNLRVWLSFEQKKWGKRTVNKLKQGTLLIGAVPDPEDKASLCMVDRGDRTPIELFGRSLENLSEVFHHLY